MAVGQKQTGDIGAGDQEDAADGSEKDEQRTLYVPGNALVQRHERDAPSAIRRRKCCLEPCRHRAQHVGGAIKAR
jgi:hypothetical protein